MAATLVASCAAEADSGHRPPPTESGTAGKAAAPQPFDIFLGGDLGLIEYAQKKVRDECMRDAGFPQLQKVSTGKPAHLFEELIVTAGTFMPASEEVARSRGFGRDLPAKPARLVARDVSFDRNLKTCGEKAWRDIAPDAKQTWVTYFELGNQLHTAMTPVYRSHPPSTVGTKMADCLIDAGYTIPDRHTWATKPSIDVFGVSLGSHVMPPEAAWQPKTGGSSIQIGPSVPVAAYVPTEAERRLASTWYQCGSAAKFGDFFLESAMRQQKAAVARYEAQFAELNPRIIELAKKAAQRIGE